ncbi:MAG: [FeFe] hydrogenase H-cluster radical SAM maturase HydE [Sedimentisphaerales bacterium]|nr:[FeFe] hydrogenase H-cluster radical SAM maturase HydE [Sedimentisphaerales bacterium]
MPERNLQSTLNSVCDNGTSTRADVEFLLAQGDRDSTRRIMHAADEVRSRYVGDGIVLRGIIEFSNYCRNTCAYCGLNTFNTNLARYRMTREQILESVGNIAEAGIKTVVLQSGEDRDLDPFWLAQVIEDIKDKFDMAVTLSVGEWSEDDYRLWRQAGGDRYLLKIETTNPTLYGLLHPGMSFEDRLRCLGDLKSLGYQTGSGSIVGLRNQTCGDLARDIVFFKEQDFDMLGIGPFIPHHRTPLADEPQGDLGLTLRTLSLARILTKDTHLPATTAVGVAGSGDAVRSALAAGANVVMLNFTPPAYKRFYEIYPGKDDSAHSSGQIIKEIETIAHTLGRYVSLSRADSLKQRNENMLQKQTLVREN